METVKPSRLALSPGYQAVPTRLWIPAPQFVANQASFAVVRRLSAWMAELAGALDAEVVVGLPTLGQVFAPPVAEAGTWTNS